MAVPALSQNFSYLSTASPSPTSTPTASGTIGGVFATNSSGMGSGGNGDTNSFNTSAGFYKNLFYILIGLLALFGAISVLSYMRARRKNAMIWREAERLGVLVPGMAGYYDGRDAVLRMVHRQQMQQRHAGAGGGAAAAAGGGAATTVALNAKDARKPEVWDAVAEKRCRAEEGDGRESLFGSKEFVSFPAQRKLSPPAHSPSDNICSPLSAGQTPLAIAPLFEMPLVSGGSSDRDALDAPFQPPPRSTLEFFPNAVAVPVQLIQRALAYEQQEAAIREAAVEADEVMERWTRTLGGGEAALSAAAAIGGLAQPASSDNPYDAPPPTDDPPSRPNDSTASSRDRLLDAIAREPALHVTVLVRMPVEVHEGGDERGKDEDAAIQEAYEGMCIGTTKLEVVR